MATILNRQVTFATNGTVTAAGLHNLIDDTEIYAGLISTQTQIASVGSSDMLLIADADGTSTSAPNMVTVGSMFNDALNNGIYTTGSFTNRVTAGSFVGALTGNVTGNITATTGTIATLNSTTATIGTLNTTAGTISVTTGTISNLSATTSTFLGTITASTNIINVGSGQIYKNESGGVGIGTTSVTSNYTLDTRGWIRAQHPSGDAIMAVVAGNTTGISSIYLGDSASDNPGYIEYNNTSNYIGVATNGTERFRVDSSGNMFIAKTSAAQSTVGIQLEADGQIFSTVSGDYCHLMNRTTSDGILVSLRQGGTQQGDISVAGTTVSYNGGHLSRWSQLLNGQRDPAIKKGTVMSNLNEMCEWRDKDGNLLANEQLNKVKISDVEGDLNTAGVFVNWDNDDQDNPFDLNMAMTGDMIIRIAQGTSVNRGDLLMSAGDGTAKPQGDDILRSKTIAKVISTNVTCTYEDGSYCVPCVLMAC
jgi:hypothetical protein